MAEVKWIKITTDMFDDEKIKLIESMPERDTVLTIWIKLICLAGRVNDGGLIYLNESIIYTEEDLSAIFNRPVNSVRLALSLFQKYKMIETTPRGICLVNWGKHQNMDTLDKIREDTRNRVKKFREKQQYLCSNTDECNNSNVTVTLPATIRGKNKEVRSKNNIYDHLFSTFWKEYPKKVAKKDAYAAFIKIKPTEELLVTILTKLQIIKKSDGWIKNNGQYIPNPATFLNGRRWEDEIETSILKRNIHDVD